MCTSPNPNPCIAPCQHKPPVRLYACLQTAAVLGYTPALEMLSILGANFRLFLRFKGPASKGTRIYPHDRLQGPPFKKMRCRTAARQLVEKARLRRSFPTERVSPALSARPGKRAGKPCCARLPNPPHMSLDSEYSSEGCGPPNLSKEFF